MIGSRRRVLYKQDGSCVFLMIRRLRCADCRRISHELPDMVIPYKHYESDTIESELSESGPAQEKCCPAENSTMNRWKHWFFLRHTFFEEALSTIREQHVCASVLILPLYPLYRQPEGWLRILICGIVNSGFWRQTRFAWDIPEIHGRMPL